MRQPHWMTYAACLGMGALVALIVSAKLRNADTEKLASSPGAPVSAVTDNANPSVQAVPAPEPPTIPVEVVAITSQPSTASPGSANDWFAAFNSEVERYAQLFQPGIEMDSSPPVFATLYASADGSYRINQHYERHQQLQYDGWSSAMENQLRSFFAVQPEIATTRVSVSCRSTECLLQFAELRTPPAEHHNWRNANTMMRRLVEEHWYLEEFPRNYQVSTTASGSAVQYMICMLSRKASGA